MICKNETMTVKELKTYLKSLSPDDDDKQIQLVILQQNDQEFYTNVFRIEKFMKKIKIFN